jgi:hypothetical protein
MTRRNRRPAVLHLGKRVCQRFMQQSVRQFCRTVLTLLGMLSEIERTATSTTKGKPERRGNCWPNTTLTQGKLQGSLQSEAHSKVFGNFPMCRKRIVPAAEWDCRRKPRCVCSRCTRKRNCIVVRGIEGFYRPAVIPQSRRLVHDLCSLAPCLVVSLAPDCRLHGTHSAGFSVGADIATL